MLSLFYIVLVIALTSVGLLFYMLFRRRISLTIFRARGYLGVSLFALLFITLIGCATAVGFWGSETRTEPNRITDTQYAQLTDYLDEYASHTERLERSYQSVLRLAARIDEDALPYRSALHELDRLTDKALLLKSSFTVQTVPQQLPPTLAHRLDKMRADDTKSYEAHLHLLISLRQELAVGSGKSPQRQVSDEDCEQIRLLVLDQIPAYTDTKVRLYALRRDIDDTYRPKRD